MELHTTFQSAGETVAAVLHLPDRHPAPGVILCHGFTGHKAETHRLFVYAARDFARHGLAALRFDFRGSGDSDGEFHEMTISREIEDARTALDFLASRPEVDARRLGALGLSMGGCVAACLAGRDSRVRSLVLWAAVAHPGKLFDERLAASFADGREVVDLNGWAIGRAFLEDARRVEPLRDLAAYQGPALVVHGTCDESVPLGHAHDFHAALGARAQLHLVAEADHTFSSLPWKEEVVARSRRFFLETLG